MLLARDVLDKEILDRDGFKGGKVDDLLLELRPGEAPIVRAILTQHGALTSHLGSVSKLASWVRARIVGFDSEVKPVEIGWEHVTRIDVTVHIDLERQAAGLMRSESAVWERLISRIPWAER